MSRRHAWVLGVGAALVTVVVYLPGLDAPFSYDAADSVGFFIAVDSWTTSLTAQRYFNNHPMYSFVAHAVYALSGSRGEVMLRFPAVVFSASAIGLVTATAARRFGAASGALAAVVIIANPEFLELGREARGYSLLTLCTVVAGVELHRRLATPDAPPRRWVTGLVVAIGVATHLYMLLVVACVVAASAARRRFDRADANTLGAGVLVGCVPYAFMADELRRAFGLEDRYLDPDFPEGLAEALLGPGAMGAVVGALALTGLWLRRRAAHVVAAFSVLAASVLGIWLVLQSGNLAPRFFLFLVPAVAWAAAAGTERLGRVAAVGGVAVIITTAALQSPEPPGGDHVDYRAAARLIDGVPDDVAVCVPNLSIPPVLAYTDDFTFVLDSGDLAACDVVVAVAPTLDPALIDAVRQQFAAGTVASDGTIVRARSTAALPRVEW